MKTETFNPTTTKMQFIKEWSEDQFKVMDKAIVNHFRGKVIRTLHGKNSQFVNRISYLDSIMGLAYTSTGMWACYGICNTEVYFDMDNRYWYSYLTMDANNICYAVLQDAEENELVIEL